MDSSTVVGLIIGIVLVIVTVFLILTGNSRTKTKFEETHLSSEPPASVDLPTSNQADAQELPTPPQAVIEELPTPPQAVAEELPIPPQAVAQDIPTPVQAVADDLTPPIQAVAEAPVPTKVDDLTLIEGIGPRVASILNLQGITNFTQLASTELPTLEKMLKDNGLQFIKPASWIQQAGLAAEGKMDELKALQDRLIGGR
jgi:predicted flap endonuclease-1-like 5' DNA nuclease